MSVRTGMTRWPGLWVVVVVVMAVGVASGALAASGGVSPTPFGIPTKKIPNPSAHITAMRGDRMWFWT